MSLFKQANKLSLLPTTDVNYSCAEKGRCTIYDLNKNIQIGLIILIGYKGQFNVLRVLLNISTQKMF